MTYWLLIPFLGLIALFQSTLVPLFAIGGLKIDLPLMIIVSWGLLSAPGDAAIWGFIIGIFLDVFSGLPFGTTAIAMTAIGLLMGLAQSALFRSNLILPPASAVIATFAYDLLILAIVYTLGWPVNWNDQLIRVILPTSILNGLTLPITYFPLQRLHHRLNPQVEWG